MINWNEPIEVYDSVDEDAVPAKLIINSNLKVIEWCDSGDGKALYDVFDSDGEHCLDLDSNRKCIDWLTVRNVEKKTATISGVKELLLKAIELL